MAIAGGTQQMNVLADAAAWSAARLRGHGDSAVAAAERIDARRELVLTPDQLANFNVGDIVAVDVGLHRRKRVMWARVRRRRICRHRSIPGRNRRFHPARDLQRGSRVAARRHPRCSLASPLIATPTTGMGVQKVMAFVDREGSSFFQEWSGLFVIVAPRAAVAPASTIRACRWRPADAKRGRNSRRPCSATCCTPACTHCPRLTPTTTKPCSATAAISRTPNAAVWGRAGLNALDWISHEPSNRQQRRLGPQDYTA